MAQSQLSPTTESGGLGWTVVPAREILDWGTFDTQLMRPPNTQCPNTPCHPHNHMFMKFSTKFTTPPVMILGLTSLEADRGNNVRVSATVEDIHNHIFSAHIRTWDGTKLYRAGYTWLAMPGGHPQFQSGTVDIWDAGDWHADKLVMHHDVVFPHPYQAPPKVVMWLNLLDFGYVNNERVMTFATDVTRTGFTANINTWGDTKLYGAKISWFAYPARHPEICSGTLQGTSGVVGFEKKFTRPPTTVLVGLNRLETDKSRRCSFNIVTEAVSEIGMGIRVEGFGDTVLCSAGVSYLAIE